MTKNAQQFITSALIACLIGALFFAFIRRNNNPSISDRPAAPQIPPVLTAEAQPTPAIPLDVAKTTPPAVVDPVPASTNASMSPADEAEISKLHREYMFATTAKQRLDILDALSLISAGEVEALEIIHLAFADADPALRRQALLVLSANGLFWSADLLPYLEAGLLDTSKDVQNAAAQLLEVVGLGRYPSLALKGLSSPDPAVQQRTMAMINITTTTVPINVYSEAMKATNSAIRRDVVDILCQQSHKRGIPLLIQALSDPDANVRIEAQHNLFFLLDEEFETPEAAAAFWKENADRFSESIFDTYLNQKAQPPPPKHSRTSHSPTNA
jgi:hypothetical protein